ncbi:hypothetical protein [Nocardia sp. NPDC051463]|uniref:phage holin n=1 Tax=Nocardia sp. NPDC051463 TaxID=3154845 RepID=UPI00344DBA6F
MNAVLSALRSEPIRTILYPLLAVLVGVLVARGVVDESGADIITGIVAAVLGIPAAEAARKRVAPWPRPGDDLVEE